MKASLVTRVGFQVCVISCFFVYHPKDPTIFFVNISSVMFLCLVILGQ